MGNTPHRRSSYFSGCISPSCIPVHDQYTRINRSRFCDRWSRKWKTLINKVIRESKKSIFRSPNPLTFRYDAVSYSQNFDEGKHRREHYDLNGHQCSQVLRECT
ncbi:hypothetical protein L1987_18170 [Smallanthus sonchifolius]|uniref:Uncharacterized protein n=1 Tax=Smallanthus sonchifolius TaxID=185202 RepID=A0ACB9J103_9ASTR|nr:hypothetical protein L1987_18170 [Smallanthus sonchifolius]